VRDGSYREDLYYRLNVVGISLPALRERPEDVPLLIARFLTQVGERLGRGRRVLAPDAHRALLAHEWQGNVRELEHAIEQAVALASDHEIGLDDLPAAVRAAAAGQPEAADGEPPRSFKEAKQRLVERFERRFIEDALARHQGNISRAAEEMGMYRQHLQLKLAEYAIDADRFRQR
jgi:two-component system response regulator HydG